MMWIKHLAGREGCGGVAQWSLRTGPDNALKSLPGAFKEATLRPILEPFPVSGVDPQVDPCVASVRLQEHTHTNTDTRFRDDTPSERTGGVTYQRGAVSELLDVSIDCNISQENNGLSVTMFNGWWHSEAWVKTRRLRKTENLNFGIICRALHNEDAISFLAACCNKKKRDLKMGLSVWEPSEP